MIDDLDKGFTFSGLRPDQLGLPAVAAAYIAPTAVRIGYNPDAISGSVRERMAKIIEVGLAAVGPAGIGRVTAIESWDASTIVARGMTIQSPRWAKIVERMVSPRQLVCFVLTLGGSFDRIKARTSLFEAYVLDAWGSEMIERMADAVEAEVSRWAMSRQTACSRRFSPGYCDWSLADGQRRIFSLLAPTTIGVTAQESGAMLPSKSVSAVIITADRIPLAYPCPFCGQRDCDHRRP